jgi:CheY-like chemotaxis protein
MLKLHRERVLLVEQPDGRDMLAMALEHGGLKVHLANDGDSALTLALAHAPAVVVADIDLPRMDGWDLARRLRKVYGAAIRLVALTSLDNPDDRARSMAAGFNAYLVKPIHPAQVQDTIRRLLAA